MISNHNASVLDPGRVQQIAVMLANATLHTEQYYGSDVKVAYRLTQSLLQHESNQQGFNLTATQDVHFTEVNSLQEMSSHCLKLVHAVDKIHGESELNTSDVLHVTLNSHFIWTESGPCGKRHPGSGHTAPLGDDPALGWGHSSTAAPLRGICKHTSSEHEEDLSQSLYHCHTKHR